MDVEEGQILKVRKLHMAIVDGIEKRSSLSKRDLFNSDMEDIEGKINIKIVNPKKSPIVFEWELGERLGWQFLEMEFVPEENYNKLEKEVNSSIKNL